MERIPALAAINANNANIIINAVMPTLMLIIVKIILPLGNGWQSYYRLVANFT